MSDNYNRVLKVVANGEVTERECLSCKTVKPLSDFQKDIHGYLQKKARCRVCCNKKQREVDYPKNKRSGLKSRPDKMLKFYGVTYEHVVRTLDEQHGLCANRACGKPINLSAPNGLERAMIDHCHTTGKFRGMLCMMCNLTLGKIEADQNLILGLMEYMTKNK
jgi:hypothetical protein